MDRHTDTPRELSTTTNSTTFTTYIVHPRPPSHHGELFSPSLLRPHLHHRIISRRLSSPVFEDLLALKTHHATLRLPQTPMGVPHTRPPPCIERRRRRQRRRRTVLTSSPSLRKKPLSTPGAGHQLLLPHKHKRKR